MAAKKDRAKARKEQGEIIGPRKLTRFERARVIGARALQVAMGAPTLISAGNNLMSPIDIALEELRVGLLPMSIRRSLPDGTNQNIPLRVLLEGKREES